MYVCSWRRGVCNSSGTKYRTGVPPPPSFLVHMPTPPRHGGLPRQWWRDSLPPFFCRFSWRSSNLLWSNKHWLGSMAWAPPVYSTPNQVARLRLPVLWPPHQWRLQSPCLLSQVCCCATLQQQYLHLPHPLPPLPSRVCSLCSREGTLKMVPRVVGKLQRQRGMVRTLDWPPVWSADIPFPQMSSCPSAWQCKHSYTALQGGKLYQASYFLNTIRLGKLLDRSGGLQWQEEVMIKHCHWKGKVEEKCHVEWAKKILSYQNKKHFMFVDYLDFQCHDAKASHWTIYN